MRFHFCILFFSLFAYLENTRERKLLEQCLTLAREILSYIDRQVDAREKEQRLFDIYNKLDARSYAMLNGKKFKVNIFQLLMQIYMVLFRENSLELLST